METLVKELGEVLSFKDSIDVGDVVLVVIEETKDAIYAYVTSIEPDNSRKDEWWNLSLSFLSIPIQKATWTLRTPQMTGLEIFTMGGKKRFIKAVELDKTITIEKEKVTKSKTKSKSKDGKSSFLKLVK